VALRSCLHNRQAAVQSRKLISPPLQTPMHACRWLTIQAIGLEALLDPGQLLKLLLVDLW
jgi:hypothetical protein